MRRRIRLTSPLTRRKLLTRGGYFLAIVLAAVAVMERYRLGNDDWAAFDHQTFIVSRVIDGDTIRVDPDTTVRLLGVDAPELPDAHWASQARDYVQARALGRQVVLRLDQVQTRDRYGRLLAYVYLDDGDCLNMDLIQDGQAYADRRFKHSYRPQYEMAENEARKKGRGLWKDITEQQMPPWRRRWLQSQRSE